MGDIGKPLKRIELEPMPETAPIQEPMPETAPAEAPALEPVPA